MNRQAISLGRILGIPIGVDYSWFLIFILITWLLAIGYYPHEFPEWATAQYWFMGAVTAIMLFVSVLLHELGHSVLAIRNEIGVRRITLFIFGGVAELTDEPPSAWAEFWIAIAGPIVSLGLALFFAALVPLLSAWEMLLALATYLAYINLILVIFNLIPGFPLDGGRVFRAVLWGLLGSLRRATLIAANVGRLIAFLFIIGGVGLILTGNFINGLWLAFIGWFLDNAASSQIQQTQVRALLAGRPVYHAMTRNFPSIPSHTTLQEMVDYHVLGGGGRRCFVVFDGNEAIGLLTLHNIKDVSRDQWTITTAEQAMTPLDELQWIAPDAELWDALGKMDRKGVNQLPVMNNGVMLGMLDRESIISYLRALQELK